MLNVMQGGDGSPPEPDWNATFADELDLAFASEQWRAVVREMSAAGTLAVANGHAIKRLVEFRVQYERAARHVAENGATIPAKRTKVPTWNLNWSVMTKADEAIRVLEAELGISPVRRGKATKVQRGKKAPAAADAYLNPAGYVQIGRVFLAGEYQPSLNYRYGGSLGYETDTQVEKSLGGAEFFDRREPYCVMRFGFDYLPEDEAFSRPLEIQRRAGTDGGVFVVPDPDDTLNMTRRAFLGRLRALSQLEQVAFEAAGIQFEVKELL